MSFKWFQWAKGLEGLKPPQKAVLLLLADYFNEEEGCAWPSQERLARDSGYNRTTIHRAIKALKQLGYISIQKTSRSSGHFSNNEYRLHYVAESNMAESNMAVLQTGTSPCFTTQQKHLTELLRKTLNTNNGAKKEIALSDKQKVLANSWASQLMDKHRGQYFVYENVLEDCERFLATSQEDEDWQEIGNGLPNPKYL